MGMNDAVQGVGVLAIDAGNSKTDVALVSPDGSILGATRGEGFAPHVVGADLAVHGLAPLVAKAAAEAGLTFGGGRPLVEHVSACLANVDLPVEQLRLEAAMDAQGWGTSRAVFNDTFALLRAGGDETRGIAVICGAGINCTGVLPDGRTARFAALGHLSGDWGGGNFLWQEAMWWAARAEDGRGVDTQLRTALPAHFGLSSMQSLIEAIHLAELTPERCLELTPLLFDVADTGDQVAVDIVHRQAREVVALALAVIRRLDVIDQPIEVLLGGGVLTAGHDLLTEAIDTMLGVEAPYAVTRIVTTPLVVGAGLLGLDHIGATAQAQARLRAAAEPSARAPRGTSG
jgi:N-acetylglucosamine kinase-like BadF-type ATPase